MQVRAVATQYPRNETALVKQMVKLIEKRGTVWTMKTHGDGYQRVGIPDLLVCYRGQFLAIEAKHQKPGESEDHLLGRVSVKQRLELDGLEKAGAKSIVAWTLDQVETALDEIDEDLAHGI